MNNRFRVRTLLLILVCLPFAFDVLFISSMLLLVHSVDAARARHQHEMTLGTLIGDYVSHALKGGVDNAFKHSELARTPKQDQRRNKKSYKSSKATLEHFVQNNDDEKHFVNAFTILYEHSRMKMRHARAIEQEGEREAAINERTTATTSNEEMLKSASAFLEKQYLLASEEEIAEKKGRELMLVVILACAVLSITLAMLLFLFINNRIVQRSNHLGLLMAKIAANQDLGERPTGTDEFAQTENALFSMAETLAEARTREQEVFDSALDIICQLDSSLRFGKVNPAAGRIWGYDEAELAGKNILSIISDADRADARTALNQAVETKTETVVELRTVSKSGQIVFAVINATWSDTDRSLFCIIRDVTEAKLIERQKEELLASASHDVRTPLTSIHITLSLFERGVFGDIPQDCVNDVKQSSIKASKTIDLISDFLDLEKMSARKAKPDIQVVALADIIQEVRESLESELESRAITVEEMNSTPVKVFVDKDQYIRVFKNLVRNSIDNAPAHSSIQVLTQLDADKVNVRISDLGPTIPKEERERIFQRYRARDGQSRLNSAGLALVVAKAIVDSHNNSIEITSDNAGRSVFELGMPGSQIH